MEDAKASVYTGYADNWLFNVEERKAPEKIAQIDYLGLTAYVTVQEVLHKACGKRWDIFRGSEHVPRHLWLHT